MIAPKAPADYWPLMVNHHVFTKRTSTTLC